MLRKYLSNLVRRSASTIKGSPVYYNERTIGEELELLAEIDGVSADEIKERALLFYCWARRMENDGCIIGGYRLGKTIFNKDIIETFSLRGKGED